MCKPVLIEQNRKTIQTGSCSFLLLGGEHFLITARHVLESHGSGPYFVGTRQGRFYLDRGHYKSSLCPQRDDKHDIAIYPLNDEDLEKLQGTGFITRDMVCTTTFPESPALVIGYPNSKNKKIPRAAPPASKSTASPPRPSRFPRRPLAATGPGTKRTSSSITDGRTRRLRSS